AERRGAGRGLDRPRRRGHGDRRRPGLGPRMSDATTPTPEPAPGPAPAPRSIRQTLASIVLASEMVVVFLASLVIWGLAPTENGTWGLPPWVALVAGGAVIPAPAPPLA